MAIVDTALITLRNVKYSIKKVFCRKSFYTLGELCRLMGAWLPDKTLGKRLVSFVGCYDEFSLTYGKDCLFFLFDCDPDWYAKAAYKNGALAVVSDREIEGVPCIVVDDAWQTYIKVCSFYFDKAGCKSIAITGSIGKTTTTEMICNVAETYFNTFCTPINGNVVRYMGNAIQKIPRNCEQFVQEVAENMANNTAYCSAIIRPNIVAITNIDKSHIGEVGSIERVAELVTELTNGTPDDGLVIINADDTYSKLIKLNKRIVSVGIEAEADCIAKDFVYEGKRMRFTLVYRSEQHSVMLNCLGRHNAYNAMMAFVAGVEMGIPEKLIIKGLRRYKPSSIRQCTYKIAGKTFYVDCFNASARSIGSALNATARIETGEAGRRIAVLGDIAEIDEHENEVYSEVGRHVTEADVDLLITYGKDSRMIHDSVQLSTVEKKHFENRSELVVYLKKQMRRGDVVLIKGSGSMKMEKIFADLYPVRYFFNQLPTKVKHGIWRLRTL